MSKARAQQQQRLVLVDAHNFLHRAFHALPTSMRTRDGEVVNAVYGFTSMLLHTIEALHPTHIAVAFDHKEKTKRAAVFDQYKAQRKELDVLLIPQLGRAREVVQALNMPLLEQPGFEADDLIATVVHQMHNENIEIVLVTSDRDFYQLVNAHVSVYVPGSSMKADKWVTPDVVQQEMGLTPAQIIDMKGLAGDASDNIPGVSGVGAKTAAKLLQKFGTVEKLYEALAVIDTDTTEAKKLKKEAPYVKGKLLERLRTDHQQALMSKQLATMMTDADVTFTLPAARVEEYDREKVVALFAQLQFQSLIKRLPEQFAGTGGQGAAQLSEQQEKAQTSEARIHRIDSVSKDFSKQLASAKPCAILAQMSGDSQEPAIDALGLCWDPAEVWVLPAAQVWSADMCTALREWWGDAHKKKITHDAKPLLKALRVQGIATPSATAVGLVGDTQLAAYILDSSRVNVDLATLAFAYVEEQVAFAADAQTALVQQVVLVARLWPLLAGALAKIGKEQATTANMERMFADMEMPLLPIIAAMEHTGIAVAKPVLKKLHTEYVAAIAKAEKTVYKLAGKEFSIGSPIQLREILYTQLQLPTAGLPKTKTGVSTSADALDILIANNPHPILEAIKDWRELTKLANTYIDVLPDLVAKRDGRIHSTFHQAVAATGRLSSSDPNMQNIPVQGERGMAIRKAFVAKKGSVLLGLDYSQIDLRCLAHITNDPDMVAVFKRGDDIHSHTARKLFRIAAGDEPTADQRRVAKTVNFGVIYGMSAFGLVRATGMSRKEAQQFIDDYFAQYPGVAKYMERTIAEARKTGYVETIFGRRRYVGDITASNFSRRSGAERMAINMPVQGTQADIIKLAMIKVAEVLPDAWDEQSEIRMLLQVHDELVFEAQTGKEKMWAKKIKKIMEEVVELRVPVRAGCAVGADWGSMEKIDV